MVEKRNLRMEGKITQDTGAEADIKTQIVITQIITQI